MNVYGIEDPVKIIAVDDSEEILAYIKLIMESEDFKIIEFTSAKKALENLNEPFDAIILDLSMPEMTGLEFLEQLRQKNRFKNIPIIILTAENRTPETISRIFSMGAADYIHKPFTPEELVARVKLHTKAKKMNDHLILKNIRLIRQLEEYKGLYEICNNYMTMIENSLLSKINGLHSLIHEQNRDLPYSMDPYLTNTLTKAEEQIIDLKNMCKTSVASGSFFKGELTEMHDKLMDLVGTDQLTHINNKIKFYDVLYEYFREIRSNRLNDLSIIMFDLDHFKSINEEFGKDVGDSVLKDVCHWVDHYLEKEYGFFRWGEVDFAILLPDVEADHARGIAEELRKKISIHSFRYVGHITCTFGVTMYEDDDLEIFLKRAQNALFMAKKEGRNCVKLFLKGREKAEVKSGAL